MQLINRFEPDHPRVCFTFDRADTRTEQNDKNRLRLVRELRERTVKFRRLLL